MNYKVCILAAGVGSRMGPLSNHINKAILPVNFKAVISHIIEKFAEDIEIIERIGLLEYRLICKKGTRADGLIPELGPHLGRTKIGAQVPKRVLELFDA